MFETIERDEERGQVGIGTLIVFIALVLVAAIAAGVLINTAGFLQSQAESTGQESTQQVSNQVQLQSAVGINDANSDDLLNKVQLTVELAPGADAVDLTNANLQYIQLQESTFTIAPGNSQVISIETPGGTSETVLDDSTNSLVVTLDVSDIESDDGLAAGDSAQVTITTDSGSQTETELNVPEPLTNDDEGVRL